MPQLVKKTQFAGKIETSEGVAETLAAADAKVLAYLEDISLDYQFFERNPSFSSFTKMGSRIGTKPCTLPVRVELKGSGTAATEPEWAKYIKACGCQVNAYKSITIGAITGGPFLHGETITGGTSTATGRVIITTLTGTTTLYLVVLTGTFQSAETITGGTSGATATTGSTASPVGLAIEPISNYTANIPSLTLAGYEDGVRKLLRGCRGNFKLNASKVGEPIMMEYSFNGISSAIADVALLSGIVYESIKPPVFYNTGFTVDSFAAKIHQFDFDLGNVLAAREDAGAATLNGLLSYLVTDRNPVISFTVELPLVASYDFYGKMDAETKLAINLPTIGTTTGNKFRFYAPEFQITKIENVDKDGIRCIKCSGPLTREGLFNDTEFCLLQL